MARRALILASVAILIAASLVFWKSKGREFVRLAWTRDKRCGVGQVWGCIQARENRDARLDELLEAIQVVKTGENAELVSSPQGQFWIPVRNREVLAEMLFDREAEVYSSGGHEVRAGDIVLDCGANIGVFTRHALKQGARLVVAAEPAPENLECLNKNFAQEIEAKRVIVYPKGVWDREDELVLRTFDDQSGGDSVALRFPGSREGPTVPLTTIDRLVAELKLDRVDFIKMDIEGAEPRALRGAGQTVTRFRPRMAISMEHRPEDTVSIPALVKELWPGMKAECGPCVWVGTAFIDRVQPDVLFVTP